ncbi:MAG: hypothetical protein HY527_18060 [Betaproteobacteria bacterium]|nr:hypothetical protein [Betaproteobacteria bacterium]
MEHTERNGRHGGILYPLLLVAAIAVIVFSIIGIATMTGLVSSAVPRDGAEQKSEADHKAKPARTESPRREPASKAGNPRTATSGGECVDCGVVDAIRIVAHPVGGVRGRPAMTAVGAGAGMLAGHETERNVHKTVSYLVGVRMDDGAYWTFYAASHPGLKQGQQVRVMNDRVVADG